MPRPGALGAAPPVDAAVADATGLATAVAGAGTRAAAGGANAFRAVAAGAAVRRELLLEMDFDAAVGPALTLRALRPEACEEELEARA